MPPRLNLFTPFRPIPLRPKARVGRWRGEACAPLSRAASRAYSTPKDGPKGEKDAEQLPDITQESKETSRAMGEQGPDLSQGTPVEEVVKGDKEAEKQLPKVLRDEIKSNAPKGSRSFSTMARPRLELTTGGGDMERALASLAQAGMVPQQPPQTTEIVEPGLKYGRPQLPLPRDFSHKKRYDPVVEQVTNLLMQHGKKAAAQRNMSLILTHLRTSRPPTVSPQRPLLPGAPPPSHLPLNPVLYLTLAVDSVAPLLRLRSQKGAAGGGVALQIPVPLRQRQRRRTAVMWILNAASKRRNRGSGKGGFAQRVAEELIAVVEGKSSVWERRGQVHKLGTAARSNMNWYDQKRR